MHQQRKTAETELVGPTEAGGTSFQCRTITGLRRCHWHESIMIVLAARWVPLALRVKGGVRRLWSEHSGRLRIGIISAGRPPGRPLWPGGFKRPLPARPGRRADASCYHSCGHCQAGRACSRSLSGTHGAAAAAGPGPGAPAVRPHRRRSRPSCRAQGRAVPDRRPRRRAQGPSHGRAPVTVLAAGGGGLQRREVQVACWSPPERTQAPGTHQ
jgi:hypothetical protein